MEDPITYLPKKEQGELLTINGYPDVGEPCMFVKGVYFSVFFVFVVSRIYIQIYWSTRWRKR